MARHCDRQAGFAVLLIAVGIVLSTTYRQTIRAVKARFGQAWLGR
jgi:hypothetical protein